MIDVAECPEQPPVPPRRRRDIPVGDSLDKDVRGALAAGLPAVLLDRDDRHAGTDVTRVRSLRELSYS